MAEDQKLPEPPAQGDQALGAEAGKDLTPAKAAADKPASQVPGEPLKAEVSRTDAPGAGASAAAAPPPATPAAQPAAPAAASAPKAAHEPPKAAPPSGPPDPP